MIRTIDLQVKGTSFEFKENIEKYKDVYFITFVNIKYKAFKVKIRLFNNDHNPVHVHITYMSVNDFRFKIETEDFYKNDISGHEGFEKLKRNKLLFNAVIKYLKLQKEDLVNSFYVLNPTLKTK